MEDNEVWTEEMIDKDITQTDPPDVVSNALLFKTIEKIVKSGYDMTRRSELCFCHGDRTQKHSCVPVYRNLVHNTLFNSRMYSINIGSDAYVKFERKCNNDYFIWLSNLECGMSMITELCEAQILFCLHFVWFNITNQSFHFCLPLEYTIEEIDMIIRENAYFPVTVCFNSRYEYLFTTSFAVSQELVRLEITTKSRALHNEIIYYVKKIYNEWFQLNCLTNSARPKASPKCGCQVCECTIHYRKVLILYENALKEKMTLYETLLECLNLEEEDYRPSKRPQPELSLSSRRATIQRTQ
jgi:hypothetical protein